MESTYIWFIDDNIKCNRENKFVPLENGNKATFDCQVELPFIGYAWFLPLRTFTCLQWIYVYMHDLALIWFVFIYVILLKIYKAMDRAWDRQYLLHFLPILKKHETSSWSWCFTQRSSSCFITFICTSSRKAFCVRNRKGIIIFLVYFIFVFIEQLYKFDSLGVLIIVIYGADDEHNFGG